VFRAWLVCVIKKGGLNMNENKYKLLKLILIFGILIVFAVYVWFSRYELHPDGYMIVDKWTGKIEKVHM
jgi:hypothetical protein